MKYWNKRQCHWLYWPNVVVSLVVDHNWMMFLDRMKKPFYVHLVLFLLFHKSHALINVVHMLVCSNNFQKPFVIIKMMLHLVGQCNCPSQYLPLFLSESFFHVVFVDLRRSEIAKRFFFFGWKINHFLFLFFFCFCLNCTGKLSVDDLNVNNNKWTSGTNSLLQNSIHSVSNNNTHQLLNNNSNKQLNAGLSNHQHHHSTHHHHHALSAAALSSPFSSLLSAGSSGYLLDPLGGLSKPTTANHLF